YPTAFIDIASEYYPFDIENIEGYPVLNWKNISCNQNTRWNDALFNKLQDKLDIQLLCQNDGFLNSPELIKILQNNTNLFDLNVILANIGVTNFTEFVKTFFTDRYNINYRNIYNNHKIISTPRLITFANRYIQHENDKITIKIKKQEIEYEPDKIVENTDSSPALSIKFIVFSKILKDLIIIPELETLKCETAEDVYNILSKQPEVYIPKYYQNQIVLINDEIEYLNNIYINNELFLNLVNLYEIFYHLFKFNKNLSWHESMFEELSDLGPWFYAGQLSGNYLSDLFLVKNSNKLTLTQELFEQVQWKMPLIFSMGWVKKFYIQFEIRSPDHFNERRKYDSSDICIDLNLGNLAKDVFIYYYPLIYKNYIESDLPLDLEIILTDVNKLQNLEYLNINDDDDDDRKYNYYRNKYYRSLFIKKLGHLISVNLTTEDLRLIFENCSDIIQSYYALPRIDQFYCANYKKVKHSIRSNSSSDELSRFFPPLITVFRKDSESIFNKFFLSHDNIVNLLNSDIICIKNATITNIQFMSLFKNLKYILLTECNIEDTNNYNFDKPTNLFLRKCELSNINFIYSLPNLKEFYFITNKIKSQIATNTCKQLDHLQTLYLENHRISELNINNELITKLGISDYNYRNLEEDLQFTNQLDKLNSLTIKWTYNYIDKDTLMYDVSRDNIFKFNLNYEIIKYLKTHTCKVQNLCLVNLYVDSQSLKTLAQENCNICIFQDYMQMIYVINHDMPKNNSINNLLFETKTNDIEEYEYILEYKRFSDDIHEMLLCDEDQDY
ncbi:MAG: hypothetical protein WAT43_19480, partial [Chitinophagales bacterium]